jgi:hypothetical protein
MWTLEYRRNGRKPLTSMTDARSDARPHSALALPVPACSTPRTDRSSTDPSPLSLLCKTYQKNVDHKPFPTKDRIAVLVPRNKRTMALAPAHGNAFSKREAHENSQGKTGVRAALGCSSAREGATGGLRTRGGMLREPGADAMMATMRFAAEPQLARFAALSRSCARDRRVSLRLPLASPRSIPSARDYRKRQTR